MNGPGLVMPEAIELDESSYSSTFGRFIVQPLERGYGVTLGNALRRMLISSIPGAAITAIRIDGVLHEFSTIPGVTEDIAEIVLNLKLVRFKLLNRKPDKVELSLRGPGIFTAGDIQKNTTDFEVLNPELHIATLNDKAKFNMEVIVRQGRGYVPAEENRLPDTPIGMIPIDSIFTPVKNVVFRVEQTRVGQRTDYDRLILEVTTDGSITPDDAVSLASQMLMDHLRLFITFDVSVTPDDSDFDDETLRIRKILKKPIEVLEMPIRAANCLKEMRIRTIADLVRRDEEDLLRARNFGRKTLEELRAILAKDGLDFGMEVEKYLPEYRIR
ncbi:MAG: DNA-directed RNA polymerase subunit alpha [bacterium]|nr:DNA-directed RNA polymerase subunit alpha [bacterium]